MTLLARLLVGFAMLALTAGGTLVLTTGPASASCAEPSTDLLATSDVAFSGVVTGRRQTGDALVTTVRVDRVFKGDVTRRVDVVSPADEVDSSITAAPDDLLLVFGQLEAGEVTSTLCLSVPGPDEYSYEPLLTELGQGTAPTPGYLKAERRTLGLTYEQFSAGRAVLGALGLIGLGYVAFRVLRARRRTSG